VGYAFAGVWQGVLDVARSVANVKLPVASTWHLEVSSKSGTCRAVTLRVLASGRHEYIFAAHFHRHGDPSMKRIALAALLLAAPLHCARHHAGRTRRCQTAGQSPLPPLRYCSRACCLVSRPEDLAG